MNSNQSVTKIAKSNLNNWDDLSPLKEQQTKSIIQLSQVNQFEIDENEFDSQPSQSNSDNNQNDSTHSKSIVTKVIQTNVKQLKFLILTTNTIKVNDDVNELLYNFDVNDIEDLRIEKYVNNLNSHSKKCNQITDSINNALDHLNLLLENYSQVSVKTRSLHVACEQLLNDQVFNLITIY